MMDESKYSDHDLLILIAERTRVSGQEIQDLKDRTTNIERRLDQQKGFFDGAKALYLALGALPTGLVAYALTLI